ncbi:molybdenum cofactor sulfurylase [Wenxinia saemankumensis]|uniref:Molybdenum cofactor sulfurylase n=1 Tax=Wenxinia saemankumensis TaxID=1447782 RepID=A0A1M6FJ19_9RHOB|nr:molybdenum cofactor sulfurylase [Wenxinia saemankumensis]
MTGAGAIRVRVARVQGSAPREVGAAMTVRADGQEGTIGGGRLEWEAAAEARAMLAEGRTERRRTIPLGPALGQCCGGTVTLSFAAIDRVEAAARVPLWIWGAGHVGRALAQVMAPLPGWAVTLVDFDTARLPDPLPDGVTPLIAADPARLAPHAPTDADHLIVTHSHELDLALCDGLLRRGFASCGLIGSATKWARFRKRLTALGHDTAQISRIACPIGDPALGKHPHAIAVGVAAALLRAPGQVQGRMDTA